jgi:tRNA(Ile)-lysidine synthase
VPIAEAVHDDEVNALFRGLEGLTGLVIAASGGPDSTALLLLAARWAKRLRRPPRLLAVTVDHGLRPQAAAEAAAVKRLARRLGVQHRTLHWRGKKPKTGLQEAARLERYRLLEQAAARAGYAHILTGHTLDDQAETVLFRLARGTGLTGLGGMGYVSLVPAGEERPPPAAAKRSPGGEGAYQRTRRSAHASLRARQREIFLVRPFLHIAKARLLATLQAVGVGYSEDPSNSDPQFTRARLRALMPALAGEGLDARGLARLAARMRRADAAIEFAVRAARAALAPAPWPPRGPVMFDAARFIGLPAEVGLRLLGRAIAHTGDEGPVELGKLEALYEALRQASRLRRTLAGAVVTLGDDRLSIERAPARRALAKRRGPARRNTAHRRKATAVLRNRPIGRSGLPGRA